MFERKAKISARLAGGIDLLIDVATLGEYGLEPVAEVPSIADQPTSCNAAERRHQRAQVRAQRRGCAATQTSRPSGRLV